MTTASVLHSSTEAEAERFMETATADSRLVGHAA